MQKLLKFSNPALWHTLPGWWGLPRPRKGLVWLPIIHESWDPKPPCPFHAPKKLDVTAARANPTWLSDTKAMGNFPSLGQIQASGEDEVFFLGLENQKLVDEVSVFGREN